MYFLFIGIIGMVLKFLEIGPVAAWNWWIVLSPFAFAAIWWTIADKTGYTKRVEIEKMDKRKKDRIEKQRDAMGMLPKKRR